MRDLLYLSETKMRALVPQLPARVRRRLGLEAGINAGVLSVRATLPAEQQPSHVPLLDPVIEILEAERQPRLRTDPELRAGDWIQFDEEFQFGEAPPAPYTDLPAHDLVYFVAREGEPTRFLLCGSRAHLLDRRQVPDGEHDYWSGFYTTALLAYVRRTAALPLPDEAALADPPDVSGSLDTRGTACADPQIVLRDIGYGIGALTWSPAITWSGSAALAGHARVLAVGPTFVLATPLYVEYAPASGSPRG